MRQLLSLILSTCFISNLLSQTAGIDSLQKLLLYPQDDTATVVRFYSVAEQYYSRNFDSTFSSSNFDSTFIYVVKGIELSKKIGWERGYARGLNWAGRYYFQTNNYARAVSELLNSLEKFETLKDTIGIVNCLTILGIVYKVVEDHRRSVHYENRAYRLGKTTNNNKFIWHASYNLANGYANLKVTDSALYYFQVCNQLANSIVDTSQNYFLGWSYQGLGKIHLLMNNNDLALSYLYKGLTYAYRINDPWLFSYSHESLSDLYQETKNWDSALYYGRRLLAIAAMHKHFEMYLSAYKRLATIYEGRNNDSAVKYYKLASLLKDSIFSSNNKSEIESLTATEEERQKELVVKQKKDQRIRFRNIQYISIAIGLVTFLIFFLLLSRSIIANQRLIRFLGVLALLIVFEFINLFIHPFLAHATDDSPLLTLLVMVCIAALLVPAHHRIEKWVTQRLVEKNNKIRLAAAKRTIARLEGE